MVIQHVGVVQSHLSTLHAVDGYTRGYESIVQLHMLREIERAFSPVLDPSINGRQGRGGFFLILPPPLRLFFQSLQLGFTKHWLLPLNVV